MRVDSATSIRLLESSGNREHEMVTARQCAGPKPRDEQ